MTESPRATGSGALADKRISPCMIGVAVCIVAVIASIQASLFVRPNYYPTADVRDACTGDVTTTQLPIRWPYLIPPPSTGEQITVATLLVRHPDDTHPEAPFGIRFYWIQQNAPGANSEQPWNALGTNADTPGSRNSPLSPDPETLALGGGMPGNYNLMFEPVPIGACTSQTACFGCDAHNIISMTASSLVGFTGLRVFVAHTLGYLYGNGLFQMFSVRMLQVHDAEAGNISFVGALSPSECSLIDIFQGAGKVAFGNRQVSVRLHVIPRECVA